MKIEISDFYKQKGYTHGYEWINKENRKMISLFVNNKPGTLMTYAKYLFTSHYEIDVQKGCDVDHINGDKTDDRIENLQIISGRYNRQKDHQVSEKVILTCPICGQEFMFDKHNLAFKNNPTCSKKCGYIKTSKTLTNRKLKNVSKEEIEELLKLKLTCKEIAKRLNMSTNTLKKYRQDFNI